MIDLRWVTIGLKVPLSPRGILANLYGEMGRIWRLFPTCLLVKSIKKETLHLNPRPGPGGYFARPPLPPQPMYFEVQRWCLSGRGGREKYPPEAWQDSWYLKVQEPKVHLGWPSKQNCGNMDIFDIVGVKRGLQASPLRVSYPSL